jgi:hypothetical protein
MPGLVASIHAFVLRKKDVDGRNWSGHDHRRANFSYAALPDVIFCAGLPGTFESSMLSPSAIVGWARTALASLL